MAAIQRIDCDVTFLSETPSGPIKWPKHLTGGSYRPHLVVGAPDQRKAKMVTRTTEVEYTDGSHGFITSNKFIDEEMLGVLFERGPENPKIGESLGVTLVLLFWPSAAYEALAPGATFTIREGANVVGFGTVIAWQPLDS
jgi:hypothetical protein